MKHSLHAWPRDAWLVLAARALGMAVTALVMVTLVLRVHDAGGGPLGNTVLMIALAVPAIATMGLAGQVADRFDSRRVLGVALALQVLAALALAFSPALPWTYAWALVLETGYSFASPVWLALVPRIVGDDRVQQLAGAQMLISSLTGPLGAAAGGVLVGTYGTQVPPLVAAGCLALACLLSLAIRTRRHEASASPDADPRGGGLRTIMGDPVLAAVLLGALVLVIVVQGVNVVEVFLARDVLGATPEQYGLSELFFAAGSLAASGIVARLSTDLRRTWAVVTGFGVTGAVCALIAVVPTFAHYLGVLVLLGLANATANGATGPLFLLRTPEARRGRVMATLSGTFAAAGIVALVLGGLVGTWLGPRATFWWGGLASVGVVAVMGLVALPAAHRDAARAESPEPTAPAPDENLAQPGPAASGIVVLDATQLDPGGRQLGRIDTVQPAGRPSA